MTRKRLLPIADKSLMAEILPNPNQAAQAGAAPRDRVRARLAQLSENAAVLAAAASVAACSDSHGSGLSTGEAGAAGNANGSGGSVAQAGSGAGGMTQTWVAGAGGKNGNATGGVGTGGNGSGGKGNGSGGSGMSGAGATSTGGTGGKGTGGMVIGVGGYAVVDPLPDPSYVCMMLMIQSASAQWQTDGTIAVTFQLAGFSYGVTLDSATGPLGFNGIVTAASSPFGVKVARASVDAKWAATTTLMLNFTCKNQNGGPSTTAQASIRLDTSNPAMSGNVPVTISTK